MARSQFSEGTRLKWKSSSYVISKILMDGKILLQNLSYGGFETFALQDLLLAWKQRELVFALIGNNVKKAADGSFPTRYDVDTLALLPAVIRDETLRRYKLILPFIKLPANKRTKKIIYAYAESLQQGEPATGTTVKRAVRSKIGGAQSGGSIWRWLQVYLDSSNSIRALVPKMERQGGTGTRRLNEDVEAAIQLTLEWCKGKPAKRTLEDIERLVITRLVNMNRDRELRNLPSLEMPAITTIYRRVLDFGADSVLRRRLSRVEAQADSPVMQGPRPTRINEVIELDTTILDLIVVDDDDRLPIGKPAITLGIDKYSIAPWGLSVGFIPAGYQTTMNGLLHGILPKDDCQQIYGTKHPWLACGLPETIVTDNGPEFDNRALEDALMDLGINWERMPRRTPWWKAHVERFIKTQNTGLIHKLPGTTYSNTVERGDYDSEGESCISYTAFMQLLHKWLLDDYCEDWHKHKGVTAETFMGGVPSKIWQKSVDAGFEPWWHHSAEEVCIMLLPSDNRVLQRTGIHKDHIVYNSSVLASWRSRLPTKDREVLIKWDMGDRNYIYVQNPLDLTEWIHVPSTMPEYTENLQDWKHRKLVAKLNKERGEVDYQSLLDARNEMEAIAKREYEITRRTRIKTRKLAARMIGRATGNLPGMVRSGSIFSKGTGASAYGHPNASHSHTHSSDVTRKASRTKKEDRNKNSIPQPIDATVVDASVVVPLDLTGFVGTYNLPSPNPQQNCQGRINQ